MYLRDKDLEFHEIALGVEVPVIGLGTWGMGGRQIEDHRWDDETIMIIRMAIDLGMTHIDTAEYYGAGHSEELVGQAIEPYYRDDLFITTKVWRNHLHYEDLLDSMQKSLKRLKLDFVDLYLIHWPNTNVPLLDTMRALEKCVQEGYTRFIGVSNFNVQLMQEAQSYLKDTKLVANQVEYSLLDQKPKIELLPYIRKKDATLISYRPLGRGSLTRAGYKALDELAERYQKSRAQIALNWLISQKDVITIPMSMNPVHLMENIGAVDWKLTLDDKLTLADSFI
jgi:diketogulonate reductase-like aldo/keto reductase